MSVLVTICGNKNDNTMQIRTLANMVELANDHELARRIEEETFGALS